MNEWLGGALALVALAVVGVAIMARRDKVSLRAELHTRMDGLQGLFNAHAATISGVLRNLQPPAPAKPVDEAKPFIMNSAPTAIQHEANLVADARLASLATYPVPQPKEETAMRNEMDEGQALVAAMPESKYPGIATAYGRVIHWYCEHPESTYQDAYKAVVIDGASTYASVTEQPYQTGRFPIEALAGNVNASLYLNVMSGRYTAAVHRSIWTDMLRGDKAAVADFINLGGSTNAGLMSTFNVDAYSSPVKDTVVQAMGA